MKKIKEISPEWEDMIRHAADECRRLGLKLTMHNCPGWSMTGGQRMLLSTALKLKELVLAGAIVLGEKPWTSPSLMDDEDDVEIHRSSIEMSLRSYRLPLKYWTEFDKNLKINNEYE